MDKWKVVPRKTIYKSKLFSVLEQEVTLPNKKKRIYGFVKRVPTVIVFPITPSYELYLISEYRTLYKKRVIEAIAGHVDLGESPIAAAKRELKEEAGLVGSQWEQIAVMESSGSIVKGTIFLFLVKDLILGEASPTEEEDISLMKFPLDEAVKKVMSGEIYISATVIGILMLDKLRREKRL